MTRRLWIIAVVGGTLAPAVAVASEDFGGNNDNICLVSQSGVNKICIVGGNATTMDWPYVVNGGGGMDTIRVRSSSDCSCTCAGTNSANFIYGDDLELNGETDHDSLYGADSGANINYLNGGGTYDYIRGGKGDEDHLTGEGGADVIYDPEGTGEVYDGGGDSDSMRDNGAGGCDYNDGASTCGLQGGTFYSCAEIPALCTESTSAFTLSCPP